MIKADSNSDIVDVGGLVGVNNGQIDMCYANGEIDIYTFSICRAGMLVGINNAHIYNSYSDGQVHSSSYNYSYAGGITGVNSKGGVYNCYSICKVSSSSLDSSWCYAGGLVGINLGTIYDSLSAGAITSQTDPDGYLGTSLVENISYAGGIVGSNGKEGNIINCYRLDEQSIIADRIDTSGIPVTQSDINSTKLYTDVLNWSSEIWVIKNGRYPYHK